MESMMTDNKPPAQAWVKGNHYGNNPEMLHTVRCEHCGQYFRWNGIEYKKEE